MNIKKYIEENKFQVASDKFYVMTIEDVKTLLKMIKEELRVEEVFESDKFRTMGMIPKEINTYNILAKKINNKLEELKWE